MAVPHGFPNEAGNCPHEQPFFASSQAMVVAVCKQCGTRWINDEIPPAVKAIAYGPPCPDCAVSPGQRHVEGCDVARCPRTGFQALRCGHTHAEGLTIWKGEWPGVAECREWGWYVPSSEPTSLQLEDLNRLMLAAVRGEVVWDSQAQRWRKSAEGEK